MRWRLAASRLLLLFVVAAAAAAESTFSADAKQQQQQAEQIVTEALQMLAGKHGEKSENEHAKTSANLFILTALCFGFFRSPQGR